MMRFVFLVSLPGLLFALALPARAQGPVGPRGIPGYSTPPVSPYVNLARGGGSPAVNYYGLVRPEFQFQNALQGLQQQVTGVEAQTAAQEAAGLPSTGHQAIFMNYSHYFATPATRQLGGRAPLPGTAPPNQGAGLNQFAGGAGYRPPTGAGGMPATGPGVVR